MDDCAARPVPGPRQGPRPAGGPRRPPARLNRLPLSPAPGGPRGFSRARIQGPRFPVPRNDSANAGVGNAGPGKGVSHGRRSRGRKARALCMHSNFAPGLTASRAALSRHCGHARAIPRRLCGQAPIGKSTVTFAGSAGVPGGCPQFRPGAGGGSPGPENWLCAVRERVSGAGCLPRRPETITPGSGCPGVQGKGQPWQTCAL